MAKANDAAMLMDVTKCIACKACIVACKQWNELPAVETKQTGGYENPTSLSANTWTMIKFKEIISNGKVKWIFRPNRCFHCTDAACAKVCPSGALYHHELGFVAYNRDKCTGCGYCTQFCPYSVPHLDGNTITGKQKMGKCVFCQDRVTSGNPDGNRPDLATPACAKTCPTGAIKFFPEYSAALAQGQTRVEALKANNAKANLYGQNELSGLHMLYVLDDSPEVYDLPKDPKVPTSAYLWQDYIQWFGYGIGGAALLGLAANYVVARSKIKKED
jgi:formate dehydrogenase iron-sulfur subunit